MHWPENGSFWCDRGIVLEAISNPGMELRGQKADSQTFEPCPQQEPSIVLLTPASPKGLTLSLEVVAMMISTQHK